MRVYIEVETIDRSEERIPFKIGAIGTVGRQTLENMERAHVSVSDFRPACRGRAVPFKTLPTLTSHNFITSLSTLTYCPGGIRLQYGYNTAIFSNAFRYRGTIDSQQKSITLDFALFLLYIF